MREFFVAFRSRGEAVSFSNALASYRVASKVINTPAHAKVGCGLSVKLFFKDMPLAKKVLERGRYASVIGFFYYNNNNNIVRM